jgi:Putative prokaryotic signal transducing protein
MQVVATTNDWVRLSFLSALLRDAGIEPVVLDAHVAATEGSIGAIPRRLAVATEDARQALRVLREAGELT